MSGSRKRHSHSVTGRHTTLLTIVLLTMAGGAQADSGDPTINVWYGSEQRFGHVGIPQKWFNVLGNVSDADGIASLTYSLNGGPELPLSIGPDTRRLAHAGDFNVELHRDDLIGGLNQVVITATDALDNSAIETVTVEYLPDGVWPAPFAIDWPTVTDMSDAVQIVDGLWDFGSNGIRPVELGYDRVIAIGDIAWEDYELTVPITIHATDPDGYGWPSIAPGLGIVVRWQGHSDWGGWQPTIGWLPMGVTAWYDYGNNGGTLHLEGDYSKLATDTSGRKLEFDVRYIWKMQAASLPGEGTWYGFKLWEDGQPEPAGWDLAGMQGVDDLPSGSFLLVAHHVDATFGDVVVQPLETSSALVISNILVNADQTSAEITWSTNRPATSSVAYGLTSDYELGTQDDPALVTNHSIVLTGLELQTQYHYQITSVDEDETVGTSAALIFTTLGAPSTIVSDDFSAPSLNTDLWTYSDPVGDVSSEMTGSQFSMTIPAGVEHDVWVNGVTVPRIMQAANNGDFGIEVKFESAVTERYQSQGIIVEESADHFLRFDFYHDGEDVRVFAASIWGEDASVKINSAIADGCPLYLRVNRCGGTWTLAYSYDGQTWSSGGEFGHAMTVTSVGAYAGSSGTTASNGPGHTCLVDYFFNTASPIVPEDGGGHSITVTVMGDGAVTRTPDQPIYLEGEQVELEAVPDTGWSFHSWDGDLAGCPNPVTVTIAGDISASVIFVADDDVTPPEISNIEANPSDTVATISWTTNEPATSSVAYGPTTAYENGSVDETALVLVHSLTLTDLTPATVYHYQITSRDGADNSISSVDLTFVTTGGDASGIVSDDFSSPALNDELWTFVDPVGDATLTMNGTQLFLSVPTGSDHDIWVDNISAPWVRQPANNTDFEIEVKFESMLGDRYQTQGVLVEGDDNWLRFDFHSDGMNTRIFAAVVSDEAATTKINNIISDGAPLYMRINRTGDQWALSYSHNGVDWAAGGNFVQSATVIAVGVFVGNSGAIGCSAPAHTGVVDYFFNTASPIVPEDGGERTLMLNVFGAGAVNVVPDQTTYLDGEQVELEAVADPGWTFDGWDGDLSGDTNPETITIAGDMFISAVFTEDVDVTEPVIENIEVIPTHTEAVVTWTTDEPATSGVAYGLTTAYEAGTITDPDLVTAHSIELTNLQPDTEYHYKITSQDASSNGAESEDRVFHTIEVANIASDDFCCLGLDTEVWTYIDPLGDATLTMTGDQVSISVPGGSPHAVSGDGAFGPRIMQTATNTDFEIEVKFDSGVTEQYQIQGVLIEQDSATFLHFEFYSDGSAIRLYAAYVAEGSESSRIFKGIGGSPPLWMRVTREGDYWTMIYSYDGENWLLGGNFTEPLTVTSVGVFAANVGEGSGPVPGHTAVIDYFFNTAAFDSGVTPGICEIENDCNSNGVSDACDLIVGTCEDCNTNGIPDQCDIADATSQDANSDGVPDECQVFLPGDFDGDEDVDLDDYAALFDCMAGPNAVPNPTPPITPQDCLDVFDVDTDGDVDLLDVADFVVFFTEYESSADRDPNPPPDMRFGAFHGYADISPVTPVVGPSDCDESLYWIKFNNIRSRK